MVTPEQRWCWVTFPCSAFIPCACWALWIGFPHHCPAHAQPSAWPRCGGSTWNAAPAFWWMSWVWWIELRLGTGSSSCLPRRCSAPGSRKPRACQKEVTELTASFSSVFAVLRLLLGVWGDCWQQVQTEPGGRLLSLESPRRSPDGHGFEGITREACLRRDDSS